MTRPIACLAILLALAAAPACAEAPPTGESLDLTAEQVRQITIGQVILHDFPVQQSAVGSIDFDEDTEAQVFPPYQGKILQLFVRGGDPVQKTQILYTIDSPDLVQAESTLISSDGTLRLTNRALARARDLYRRNAMAQKDYDQAVSDQQTAEGSLHAARDGVRIFGKTDAEIDRILATRHVDPALIVRSPVTGVVVSRQAAPGTFVQPGTTPAPLTVADTSVMWMLANVPEDSALAFKPGQPVAVQVDAVPGRTLTGRVRGIGTSIDTATRRLLLRSDIEDPIHILRSGMFASFTITTGAPQRSPAVPQNGIVREGDGTMTAWVTTDRRHFMRRAVTTGMADGGWRQVIAGLRKGETVVTDGAIFLSNMLTADPT